MFDKLKGKLEQKVKEIVSDSTLGHSSAQEFAPIQGKRKALLIGINYFGTKAALKGCINDVQTIKEFITCNYGFNDIRIMTDDGKEKPTRANMIQGMQWLVNGANAGDSLFLHFSGHGSKQKDGDGDEVDGFDESICPVDYESAGMIVDDELHCILVKPLLKGNS